MRIFSLAADTSKALDSFLQHLKPPLFRLTKLDHRMDCPPYLMFELTSYQSPAKGLPSSRASFEPIEKQKMKFRWISSNSRRLSARVHIFSTQIDVILKADCWFVLLPTWSVLPIKLKNDKSAGLWMVVKACSCWLCFRCYLGHLMVTFDTKVWIEAGDFR